MTPTVICLPKSTDDVARFVTAVKPFTLDGSVPFTNSLFRAVPTSQGGITIDLDLLTGVEIKDRIVSVASGERWGTI
ncbi:hypothetical protein VSDG_06392 [Cytospora chrysosperma]|uniref:FAD linked oxidase N-terminal domain-containing protein n=1 Tax=Cytospora chrysosperma TaxID=252740 RepID=A0A423VPF9_CYTCH|nr:hypothetical protein VSDG_06392 [Valsa sordida]